MVCHPRPVAGPPRCARVGLVSTIPPMWSWQEFVDRAGAPDTIADGSGRRRRDDDWAGATWDEALTLATNGWTVPLPEADVAVTALREDIQVRAGGVLSLVPVWDVTGSEVDVAAYLAGVPECMIDWDPRALSSHGRVVTFLVPAGYSHTVPRAHVMNRGVALTALCSAIISAAHSVEVWSGYAGSWRVAGVPRDRYCAVARVISAGEPLDVARLLFAMAHPAMLRRLWFGVWDSAEASIAARMPPNNYGVTVPCAVSDLPGERTDAYVFPPLVEGERQWQSPEAALAWCTAMFTTLGLIATP